MHTLARIHTIFRSHPWTLSFVIIIFSFGVINSSFYDSMFTQNAVVLPPPVLSALSMAYTLSPHMGATVIGHAKTTVTIPYTSEIWVTSRTDTTATIHFNLPSPDITHIALSLTPSFEGIQSELYSGAHTLSVAPNTTVVYVRFFAHDRVSEMIEVPIPSIVAMIPGTPLTRTLFTGMSGDDVDTLQTFLVRKGYLSTTTGYYDRQTFSAVRRVQQDSGIEALGITGPETRKFINQFIITI